MKDRTRLLLFQNSDGMILPLKCDPLDLDRYRRTIGRCKIESTGQDIGSWMVRQGYAVAYTRPTPTSMMNLLLAYQGAAFGPAPSSGRGITAMKPGTGDERRRATGGAD